MENEIIQSRSTRSITTYLTNMLLGHVDTNIHQITDNLIHIFTMETNFRELGRLHFNERRLRQLRNTPSDLRLGKHTP